MHQHIHEPQAAADGGEPAPKKKRKDRGDKGERGSSRPQRLRRQGGDSPEAGGSRQAAAAYEEVPEDQIQETEADQDFIDDDGEQHHAHNSSTSGRCDCNYAVDMPEDVSRSCCGGSSSNNHLHKQQQSFVC